jgi:hypothetical protein
MRSHRTLEREQVPFGFFQRRFETRDLCLHLGCLDPSQGAGGSVCACEDDRRAACNSRGNGDASQHASAP